MFFNQNMFVYATFFLVIAIHFGLFYTRWGLRSRSVGEHPKAADTVGIDVFKTRYRNVIMGGCIAGFGGAFLTLSQVSRFEENLTAGIGFIGLAAVTVVLAMALGSQTEGIPGTLFLFGIVGLYSWRRFRNRRIRLARRVAKKMNRMEEVRLVALDGMGLTVLADQARARTYVRANAIVDSVNSKMFFGDPFTIVVRDDVSDEDAQSLLTGPGVLYVRDEAPTA